MVDTGYSTESVTHGQCDLRLQIRPHSQIIMYSLATEARLWAAFPGPSYSTAQWVRLEPATYRWAVPRHIHHYNSSYFLVLNSIYDANKQTNKQIYRDTSVCLFVCVLDGVWHLLTTSDQKYERLTDVGDEWTAPDIELDNRWTIRHNKLQTGVVETTAVGHVNVTKTQLMSVCDGCHVCLRSQADTRHLLTTWRPRQWISK